MATYAKIFLSGSTNGKAIKVVQTATAGDTIHTAVAGTSDIDEVWLYASNNSATTVKLTIEWGEADTKGNIECAITGETGLFLIVSGLILNNGLVIRAFAGTANVINIVGYVNRIIA